MAPSLQHLLDGLDGAAFDDHGVLLGARDHSTVTIRRAARRPGARVFRCRVGRLDLAEVDRLLRHAADLPDGSNEFRLRRATRHNTTPTHALTARIWRCMAGSQVGPETNTRAARCLGGPGPQPPMPQSRDPKVAVTTSRRLSLLAVTNLRAHRRVLITLPPGASHASRNCAIATSSEPQCPSASLRPSTSRQSQCQSHRAISPPTLPV